MKNIIILLVLSFALLFSACDNSINLATDWKETTVVYSFLDRNDSISYIKVTKAFLGNDNIYTLAGIRDSSEYENISVQLEKYRNEKLIKTFDFEPIEIDNKDSGVFYNPFQTVYAATTYNELDAVYSSSDNYTYKVKVINNSGEEVGAEIPLVSEIINLRKPRYYLGGSPPTISFINNTSHAVDFEWDTVTNGYITNVSIEINILELLTNGETVSRVIPWNNVIRVTNYDEQNGKLSRTIPSLSFFNTLVRSTLYTDQAKEDAVKQRRLEGLTLVYNIASRAYYDYVSVSSMSSGMNQDLPNYTNVDNGLGLIASRITHRVPCILSDYTKSLVYETYDYVDLKYKNF